ncbi:MAG: hypothetical protein V4537_17445 [Pseudomonadota bacterium]
MTDTFDAVYDRLREVMLDAVDSHIVAVDAPGNLVIRTSAIDPSTGQPGWFGTVTIKKSYVAYHLMPLYTRPSLADGLSEALSKRRQGKTCFNFKTVNDALFDELAALTVRANGG